MGRMEETKGETMTFAEILEAVTDGQYAQRSWWAQEHGNKIIGLRDGVLRQFRYDYWSAYNVDHYDIKAIDWVIIPQAPTIDALLPKVEKLQTELQESKTVEAMASVLELRYMLNQIIEDDKRNLMI